MKSNTKVNLKISRKKIYGLMAALSVGALALGGCSKPDTNTNTNTNTSTNTDVNTNKASVRVVTTNYASYDFARNIVGDKGEVKLLLPPGAESHSFEPTPQDIRDIEDCDVFVYVGGDSDTWVMGVLESLDRSNMQIVTLMDCVEVVPEELVEGMEEADHDHDHEEGDHSHEEAGHDHEEGDHEHEEADHDQDAVEYDEHVWTSPKNAQKIVAKIAEAIEESDKDNADFYKENTASYIKKLEELDKKFREAVENSARKTLVFGDRFPFRYLTDAYGLTYYAAFPGCSAETEASAATVKFLIDKVEQENIPVVFHLELSNKKMAETISEATGAKVMQLHSCHNVSKDEMDAGVTYLEIMEQNAEALKEALN